MEKEKKVEWTKEQEEVINQMIKESEDIGYTQGHDEAIREILQELESKIREIKLRMYVKK